ncbi:unnamed protein product [Ectocarpus fasciculatus]
MSEAAASQSAAAAAAKTATIAACQHEKDQLQPTSAGASEEGPLEPSKRPEVQAGGVDAGTHTSSPRSQAGTTLTGTGGDEVLERARELMARHRKNREHRGADHFALVPEVLECLQIELPLINDKTLHDKGKLLSVFQLCEEAVLAASDDCSDDNDVCKKTLGLAKAVVVDMLTHKRLGEVRTSTCRERLDRYVQEIDDLLQRLDEPLPHSTDDKAGSGGGGASGSGGSAPLLASTWSEEERTAMTQLCEQRFLALLPHTSYYETVEGVRQGVEWALRQRFSQARVLVFGSSAMNLSTPESDIDLTLYLPSRVELMQELKGLVESKRRAALMAEEGQTHAVQLLRQRASMEEKLSKLNGTKRGKLNDLSALMQSRDKTAQKLDALKVAHAARKARKLEASSQQAQDSEKSKKSQTARSKEEQQTHTASAATAAQVPVPDPAECTAEDKDKDRNDALDGQRAAEPEKEDKEVVLLESRLAASERGIKTGSRAATEAEAAFEEKKRELRDWIKENFDNASPNQKKAVEAIIKCRASLAKAEQNLKATSKIVFEMKRVMERRGFTDVMAVHRSRVPVVKTCVPRHLWGPAGHPIECDISINNLVAVHNTRLVKAYTELDPRCHRLLYLVKAWAKARGVGDSSKGTLSSYGHCLTVLHYLTRVGVVPSLLKEHKSFSKESDAQPTPPAFGHADSAVIVEGIDVSFSNTNPGTLPPPLSRDTPGRAIHGSASEADSDQDAADSCPDVANYTVDGGRSGSEGLAIRDATICDLLLGYFRHLAEDFCHAKEVMTLRPKTILNKADVWARPKLWRTSVEDPFETFDSTNPHDLGTVLSRAGQTLLHQEWKRGYVVMKKGGSKAIQELFETCARAARNGPKNVPGLAKKDGGGARGGRAAGTGNGRNTAVQGRQHQHVNGGAGRLWSPAGANGSHHQRQQQKRRPVEGRTPPPVRGMPQGQGRSLLPMAGIHQQQQQHALHHHQHHQRQQQQQQQQPLHHANGAHHHLRYQQQRHNSYNAVSLQPQPQQQQVQSQQHPSHDVALPSGTVGGFAVLAEQPVTLPRQTGFQQQQPVHPGYQPPPTMPMNPRQEPAGRGGGRQQARGRVSPRSQQGKSAPGGGGRRQGGRGEGSKRSRRGKGVRNGGPDGASGGS